MTFTITTSLNFALISVTIWIIYLNRKRPGKLPPGPKGYPLVGNIFQLQNRPWHTFVEWKKTYGDIIYLRLFNQDVIVLNSAKVAGDLLDRRAANYSQRFHMPVTDYLVGGLNIAYINPGVTWRSMRRAAREALNIKASTHYYPMQMRGEFKNFINSLVDSGLPGKYLANHVPILEHLPDFMSKWKRDSKAKHRAQTEKFLSYFLPIKEATLQKRETGSSFCSMLAKMQDQVSLNDLESAWLAASLCIAAFETTETTMNWPVLAMITFPEVQHKAQEEFDRVIGRARIPTLNDLDSLPYMRAVLRWRPALPMSLFHASLEDDIYEGYYIPKGCLVIPNVTAINHDEEIYGPNPDEFRPERFLNEDDTHKPSPPDTKDEGHHTFGFGHRICSGRHLAFNTLFTFAIVLWAMHLEAGKDGDEISTEDEAYGITSQTQKYSVSTRARFPEALEMLNLAKEEWL
ncbi:cytochrome p450 [Moniliophthora roreri MCA 2997]|uniref:Cytochrome p450 n=1 Tax=Moniliophthora roreri (strain MCA 2997) TaxID=1381753 RepID=V2WFB6_MONRO|nr:cytochrome p450 [Moniliophthora roreri MCA 2997]